MPQLSAQKVAVRGGFSARHCKVINGSGSHGNREGVEVNGVNWWQSAVQVDQTSQILRRTAMQGISSFSDRLYCKIIHLISN